MLFPNGKTSGTVEKFRSVKENPGRFSIILKNQNYWNFEKQFDMCSTNLNFVLTYAPMHKFCACYVSVIKFGSMAKNYEQIWWVMGNYKLINLLTTFYIKCIREG